MQISTTVSMMKFFWPLSRRILVLRSASYRRYHNPDLPNIPYGIMQWCGQLFTLRYVTSSSASATSTLGYRVQQRAAPHRERIPTKLSIPLAADGGRPLPIFPPPPPRFVTLHTQYVFFTKRQNLSQSRREKAKNTTHVLPRFGAGNCINTLLWSWCCYWSFFILLWWRPNVLRLPTNKNNSPRKISTVCPGGVLSHTMPPLSYSDDKCGIASYCIAPPPADSQRPHKTKNLGTKSFRRTPYLYSACRRRRRLVSKIKKRGSDRWYMEQIEQYDQLLSLHSKPYPTPTSFA